MRFMVMVKATATTEAGTLPKTEDFAAMAPTTRSWSRPASYSRPTA